MKSEVQIHMMLPIAGMQTLRELFANQYEVLVHATVVCKPGFTSDASGVKPGLQTTVQRVPVLPM
jgi:hypothetical protein